VIKATPLVSVAAFEPSAQLLKSLGRQTEPRWELLLLSPPGQFGGHRVRPVPGPVSSSRAERLNAALRLARGRHFAWLRPWDELAPDALAAMGAVVEENPDADYFYSDDDERDGQGVVQATFHKPDWSPERLRAQFYPRNLGLFRTDALRQAGGFRTGFDGAEDWDAVLRVTESGAGAVHVRRVLAHRIAAPAPAEETAAAGRRAVADHVARLGLHVAVEAGPAPGLNRLRRRADPGVAVSVVIPTRGSKSVVWGRERVFVVDCVRSVLERSGVADVEVVAVCDLDTPPSVLARLRDVAGKALTVVPHVGPFNFSAKCNLGVLRSRGDVVVLLNDDMEVVTDGFLAELAGPLEEPDVGLTGARLLFADDTIQHAGLVTGGVEYQHAFKGVVDDAPGPWGALQVNREATGLTGACVALRREVYDEVGGLAELLPVNFNDVDLGFKIASTGRRLVWLADVRAFHFESQSRHAVVQVEEHLFIQRRWPLPPDDPYLPGVLVFP
jgi:GT2 family glycosyltransferase